MMELSYRRHRFPPVVIQHAVWLYLRFTLSYRDVEDLLAERGLDVSHETVRRWVLKFGPANRAKAAPAPSSAERSLALGRECAANVRPATGVRSRIEDEVGPSKPAVRGRLQTTAS